MYLSKKKHTLVTKLPLGFDQVEIEPINSEKRARELIKSYQGNLVLLKDTHHVIERGPFLLGIPKSLEEDDECYEFQRIGQNIPEILHYHDLQGLLVPSKFSPLLNISYSL